MKNTHKIILLLLLALILCVAIACLCACSDGVDGKDGTNGKSAYEIWLDEGHTGSQTDFLNWLKGKDGTDGSNGNDGSDGTNGTDGSNGSDGNNGLNGLSAYEIFVKQYPYYVGTEEQWIIALVNGDLKIHTVTFKSEVSEDIVKYVVGGYALTDIPQVPEKEGQTSAEWDAKDFANVTQNIEVNAVYDMRKYVTFHNEFTDDEDIVITVNYGEAITDIPAITAKAYNDSKWSVTDFSRITTDLKVEAVYATQGLHFSFASKGLRVSKGEMNSAVEELFIPAEYDERPITVIDANGFQYSAVKFVYIPDGVTEIRENAFTHCTNLTNIVIPNSVTAMGEGAFSECTNLVNVTIPDNVTIISDELFYDCESLTTVNIPNSVTSIGSLSFNYCSKLKNIIIPQTVRFVGSLAFNWCDDLESVCFTNGTEIYNNAFENCKKLQYIVITCGADDACSQMESDAFEGCVKLEAVYFNGTKAALDKLLSDNGNDIFANANIYL